ncbi:MAG: cyclic nucleotide-binding domain-containing protein [Verrucomicrobiota bacterium]
MERDLLKVPVFAGISDHSVEVMLEEAVHCEVEAGTEMVKEGEPGHSMFIIRTGKVEVVKHSGSADEVRLCELNEGESFGEMCIVEPMPRAATVRSLETTTCVEIPTAAFQHLYNASLEDFNIVILNIARDLARRLRLLDDAYAAHMH